jgi:hypothetical protein
VPTRSPAGWRKEAPYDVGARRQIPVAVRVQRQIEMTIALKPARQHDYRLSAYERKANDLYPTLGPRDQPRARTAVVRIDLPKVALYSCGGDGALRRSLAHFGVDVRLTDLYPGMYAAADGYVTSRPLDASVTEHLQYAFELAGADCTAVIANTLHNTDEACTIVRHGRAGREATGRICRRSVQVDLGR